jgi:hypothetical protein
LLLNANSAILLLYHGENKNKRGFQNVKFAERQTERQIIRKTDDETTGGSLDEVN